MSGRDGNGRAIPTIDADETDGSVSLCVSFADPTVRAPAGGIPVKLTVESGNAGGEVSFSNTGPLTETTATIPAGQAEGMVTVYINEDVDTDDEAVVITLGEGANFPFEQFFIPQNSGVHQATVHITDTGAHGTPQIGFAEAASTVHEGGEGGGNVTHTVRIETNATIPSGGHLLRLAVGGTALDGDVRPGNSASAIANTDGSIDVRVLPPEAGEAPGFTLVINDDAAAEDDETLTLTFDVATLAGLPGFAAGDNPVHTLTIPFNDNVVHFSPTETNGNAATVLENAGTATLPVLLRSALDAPADGLPVTLTVTDQSGTPVSSDKVSLTANGQTNTGDFRILPSDGRRKDITVHVKPDIDTVDDTVYFTLTEQQGATPAFPRGWSVSASEARFALTITDNNGIFFAGERTEVEEGGTATVTLSIVPPLRQASPVLLNFDGSSLPYGYASLGVGGTSVPLDLTGRNITLPANANEVVFTVNAVEDSNDVSEALHLNISEISSARLPQGWSIGTPGKHVVQITDDETPAGTVNFAFLERTVDEAVASYRVELLIEGHTLQSAGEYLGITVTGNEGGDITLGSTQSGDPLVLPGANSGDNAYFTIDIVDDDDREDDEQITFTLPSSATLSDGERLVLGRDGGGIDSYTLTIRASDNIARFATSAATVAESVGIVTLSVGLDVAPAPADGLPLTLTARGDTESVVFESGISVPAGGESATVTVGIVHDSDEDNEQVTFTLGKGASFPDAWGDVDDDAKTFTLNITDTGTPPPSSTIGFKLATSKVNEPNDNRYGANPGGNTTRDLDVILDISGDIPLGEHVLPVALGGTATSGLDFQAPSSVTLTPSDSDNEVSFTVTVNEDANAEGAETIILSIDGEDLPGGFTLDSTYPSHTITIPENDLWVVLSGRDENGRAISIVGADETVGSVPLFVSLADPAVPAPAGGIPVRLEVVNAGVADDEASFLDFVQSSETTATIPAGETEVLVPVYINPDADTEPETVIITLSEGEGFPAEWGFIPQNSGVNSTVINIADTGAHAPEIGFAKAASTVHEGGEGGGDVIHTVNIETNATIPSEGHLIRLAVGGTALDGDVSVDGSASTIGNADGSIEVRVLPPEADKAPGFTLVINDDATPEDNETLTLAFDDTTFAGLPGFTAGDNPVHTLTIPFNGNTIYFSSTETNGNTATVLENAGTATLPVLLRSALDAPAGGLPVTLTVTDQSGAPVASNKVSLTANGQTNTRDFRILPVDGRRKDITVYVNPDIDTEDDTVYFTLTEQQGATPAFPRGWSVSASEARFALTITDNNGIFFAGERTEVEEGGTATVTLSIVPPLRQASPVLLNFDGSSLPYGYASLGVGGTSVPLDLTGRNITLPANANEVVFTVNAVEDSNDVSEALHLNISEISSARLPQGWSIGTPGKHVVQITDDEAPAGTVNFVFLNRTVDEAVASYRVELLIEGHTLRSGGERLGMTIAGGEGRDITLGGLPLGDPLVLPGANPGDNAYFTIDIVDDADREDDEQITFTLPSSVTLSDGERLVSGRGREGIDSYTFTIRASDNIVRFASTGATVAEDVGTYTLNLQLDDHGAPSRGLPLILAASGDTDAVLFNGDVSIAEGARTAEVTVNIVHDVDNNPEQVTFTLGEGASFPNAWGGIDSTRSTFTLNITETGTAPPASTIGFKAADSIAVEPNDNRYGTNPGGDTTSEHLVVLNVSGNIPVGGHNLSITVSGTATSGSDFESPSTIALTPDDSNGEVSFIVTINEDDATETEAETIILSIDGSNLPEGFRLDSSYPSHRITIPANDFWVFMSGRDENGTRTNTVAVDETVSSVMLVVSVADPSVPAPAGGIPVILEAVSGNDGGKVSFSTSEQSNSATTAIPAGGTEVEVPVYISADRDATPETVVIELREGANFPSEWGFIPQGSGVHQTTINIADSGSVFFAGERTEVEEGETTTVTLSIDPPLPQASSVFLDFDGSSFPYDYASLEVGGTPVPLGLIGRHITLPADANEVLLTVTATEDGDDGSEALHLNISESQSARLPEGWSIGTLGKHIVQINDNDGTYGFARAGATVDEPSGTQGVQHTIEIEVNGANLPVGGSDLGMAIIGATGDVSYGNITLENHIFSGSGVTVLPGANTGDNAYFTIDINPDEDREADEAITFTLPPEIILEGGRRFALERFGNQTYTLTIRANDNVVGFASSGAMVPESDGIYVLSLSLDAAPAPADGLPLTLTASGATDAVVFESGFAVLAGRQIATVTVGIVHDSDVNPEQVTFTLGEDTNFPGAWGGVDSTNNIFVLDITDDGTDPPASTIGFSRQASIANEPNDNRYGANPGGNATRAHTVTLDVSGTIDADYELPILISGTATSGSDFEAPSSVTLRPSDSGGTVSLTVTINEDAVTENNPESVILTIDEDNLPGGFNLDATYPSHTITIPANDLWVGLVSRNEANVEGTDVTVNEGAGPVTLVVKLFDESVPAPADGVHVRLEVVSGNDGGEVSFSETGQLNGTNATIPAGGTEATVLVYIKREIDEDETVRIRMTEGANFPVEWGYIPQGSGLHERVINITDTVTGTLVPAPSFVPRPVRPPTQETSPAPVPLPGPARSPTRETSPANPLGEFQKEVKANP